MNAIRLSFGIDGPQYDFGSIVSGFEATVQNCLVNVGTNLGSDPVYVDRGTHMKLDAAQGRMSTVVWANQTASVAALRTMAFVQQNEVDANTDKLQQFTLRCYQMNLNGTVLEGAAESSTGEIIGGLAQI